MFLTRCPGASPEPFNPPGVLQLQCLTSCFCGNHCRGSDLTRLQWAGELFPPCFHLGGLPCSLGRPVVLKSEAEEEKVDMNEEKQEVIVYD